MALSNSDPAHAAPAGAGGRSVVSAVTPQDGGGENGCVYLFLTDDSSTQVFVHAELLPGCDIFFSAGHWQILTPREHFNTPDGTYEPFSRDFTRAPENICAIWWYRDVGGPTTAKGSRASRTDERTGSEGAARPPGSSRREDPGLLAVFSFG